jgi:ankyrin repeat protein
MLSSENLTSHPDLKHCTLAALSVTALFRNGATALSVAAEEDHVEIVQLLLQNGANVSERKE